MTQAEVSQAWEARVAVYRASRQSPTEWCAIHHFKPVSYGTGYGNLETQIWFYRTGREGPPVIVYEYQKTRAGEHPREFLSGFSEYLHVDGYAGYHKVSDVTLVGCWAHARRKFDEALKAALPDSKQSTSGQPRRDWISVTASLPSSAT